MIAIFSADARVIASSIFFAIENFNYVQSITYETYNSPPTSYSL